ncbi:MAG: hypothetical protein ABJA34_12600 [Pseudonocardiales bacterium]
MYAALLVGAILGIYLLSCLLWPYKSCPACKGTGRRRSPVGISWRKCPRCKGSGEVVRVGRRVLGRRR